jgi:DeoR family transcriptional regulator of aga operon
MVEISRKTVAVCDSSKFGRRSLSNIMPVTAVNQLITDKNISKHDLQALREAGIKVTLV